MAAMDKSIKTYSLPELASVMKELGQPAFRAQQLQEWLYQRHASSYDEMTNLPGSLRATLAERFPLTMPTVVDRQISKDGTRKYLFEVEGGSAIESVFMKYRYGNTACILPGRLPDGMQVLRLDDRRTEAESCNLRNAAADLPGAENKRRAGIQHRHHGNRRTAGQL